MKYRSFSRRQIEFMQTLRAAGAITPDTAMTIDKNTPIDPKDLEVLVEVEAITRVAPYQYYLRTASRHARLLAAMDTASASSESAASVHPSPSREKIVKTILFWLIVMLIPILLLQVLGRKS
jgi:hypothetical protein